MVQEKKMFFQFTIFFFLLEGMKRCYIMAFYIFSIISMKVLFFFVLIKGLCLFHLRNLSEIIVHNYKQKRVAGVKLENRQNKN